MVSYKELGLVNTREMFAKAIKEVMQSLHLTLTTWSSCRLSSRLQQRPRVR